MENGNQFSIKFGLVHSSKKTINSDMLGYIFFYPITEKSMHREIEWCLTQYPPQFKQCHLLLKHWDYIILEFNKHNAPYGNHV